MEDVVAQFLSKGTAVIALTVVMVGFFVKRFVELAWPKLRSVAKEMDPKPMYTNKAALWWNTIGLYVLPVFLGGLFGALTKDSFFYGPDIKTTSARVFYAGVVGWFADVIYEIIQKALQKTTGVSLPNPNDRTPSVTPTPMPPQG